MGVIKDHWNVKIFLLIVLVVVSKVSLLVVFNRNFEDVNTKYNEKTSELNATFESLLGTQSQLNKTMSDLELKNLKEADLRDQYKQLKTERDGLQLQIQNLNKNIADRDSKIKSLNIKISDLEESVDKLNTKITKLDKRINCFEDGKTGC